MADTKKPLKISQDIDTTKDLLAEAATLSPWSPFKMLKAAKSCEHLLKPTPFRAIVLIIASLAVDIGQILLDLAGQSGVLINRFVDIAFGAIMALYLYLSGAKVSILALIATLVGEEIPDVDALPFWTFDAVYQIGKAWLPIIAAEAKRLQEEEEDENKDMMMQAQKKAALENHVNQMQNPGSPRPSNVIQGNFASQQSGTQRSTPVLADMKPKKAP